MQQDLKENINVEVSTRHLTRTASSVELKIVEVVQNGPYKIGSMKKMVHIKI